MKFAILGGSFNPVHKGHLRLAETALSFGYGRVIFVPAYQSPFKPLGQSGSAMIRVEMLLASVSADSRFTVDLCEIQREGISYTVDTLRDISKRYVSEAKIGIVLGDDLVHDYAKWNGAQEIAANSDILIARRNFDSINFPFPHIEMGNSPFELSSDMVRRSIAGGGEWRGFLPEELVKIIERKKLYGFNAEAESPPLPSLPQALYDTAALENWLRSSIDIHRFVHSRNVALHCYDLAERFNLNKKDAYTAGILHDMCKDAKEGELVELARQDGEPFNDSEKIKPSLLHGRAAAVYIKNHFKPNNTDIAGAVRSHTFGGSGLSALAKILYVADKIEAGRPAVKDSLRDMAFGPAPCYDIDELYDTVYKATREWLRSRNVID